MGTITAERVLSHDPETTWRAIADFGGIHRFHPLVERSPINAGMPSTGLGAERTCHFHDGNAIHERVTAFDEGRSLDVEIYDGTMPLQSAHARMEVIATDSGRAKIRMSMEYTPKFGVLGKAMDALMMRRKFSAILDSVLAGLDHHLSTGETIGPKFRPSHAA